MSIDKLNEHCSICGKMWANHDDAEYNAHAQKELELGEL